MLHFSFFNIFLCDGVCNIKIKMKLVGKIFATYKLNTHKLNVK